MTLDLDALLNRTSPPEPWSEGDKIPWNDPAFSARMLQEHLSQEHDAASRRAELIDTQVAWIHETVLRGAPSSVLDLGCGPGLYTSRLARLGHRCHGIDFGPASIAHARAEAERDVLDCTYTEADLRTADFGEGYDLAMLIFGELNVFRREDAAAILREARAALVPGGQLVVEPHTFEAVRDLGQTQPRSRSLESGLFSDRPHILLEEAFWDERTAAAIQRWFVIDRGADSVERHAQSMQAYTEEDYQALFEEAGYTSLELREDWPASHEGSLVAYVARG